MSFGSPLAIVSKTVFRDASCDVDYSESEEELIVNSDEKVVAYYSKK